MNSTLKINRHKSLDHGCPTHGLPRSEKPLSWATYKIYNIVNLHKQKSFFKFAFYWNKKKQQNQQPQKRGKQKHKTNGLDTYGLDQLCKHWSTEYS